MRGDPYELWGIWELDRHLIGIEPDGEQMLYLMGADDLGRDLFSRIVYGARVSLSIGLVGDA